MEIVSPKFCESPLVSIVSTIYNHEKFLNKCLDNLLSQKTTFDYEIILGEDCSQDNSRAICLEYQRRFPDKIKLLFHEQNQGLLKNYISVLNPARGKYIAVCSGDDYWCDELKLQRQIDFLEANSGYSMCFTNAYEEICFSWKERSRNIWNATITDREYKGDELILDWVIPASSVVFRNKLIDFSFLLKREFYAEDLVQYLKLGECGKIRGMSNITTVYLRHDASLTGQNNITTQKFEQNLLSIDEELNNKYHATIYKVLSIRFFGVAKNEWKRGSKILCIRTLYRACQYNLMEPFRQLYHSIMN